MKTKNKKAIHFSFFNICFQNRKTNDQEAHGQTRKQNKTGNNQTD